VLREASILLLGALQVAVAELRHVLLAGSLSLYILICLTCRGHAAVDMSQVSCMGSSNLGKLISPLSSSWSRTFFLCRRRMPSRQLEAPQPDLLGEVVVIDLRRLGPLRLLQHAFLLLRQQWGSTVASVVLRMALSRATDGW
jgi:hypothetical protein